MGVIKVGERGQSAQQLRRVEGAETCENVSHWAPRVGGRRTPGGTEPLGVKDAELSLWFLAQVVSYFQGCFKTMRTSSLLLIDANTLQDLLNPGFLASSQRRVKKYYKPWFTDVHVLKDCVISTYILNLSVASAFINFCNI
jgi:hypothetical protein